MTDASTAEHTLLGLLADIRAAAGDREGRLMQPELVEHIRGLKANADGAALLGQASAQVMIERDRLRADKRALLQGHEEQASEISRLSAEVEALRADAERWKWRKENPTARLVYAGGSWRVENWTAWHPSADAAVDAAIAARKGEGSES